MLRFGIKVWGAVCATAAAALLSASAAHAVSLDKDGDIKFGMRSYVNARIGTETTHDSVLLLKPGTSTPVISAIGTFPRSNSGHLRQNRFFLEAEFDHNLTRLIKQGVGPLGLLNSLPFRIKNLKYHVTFRGEGDGLYDWGPREYRTAQEFKILAENDLPNPLVARQRQAFVDPYGARRKLRQLATDRERLFQAYVETEAGDLTLRIGRQILSWGETDGFRLMDQINPIDSSFGGFLIPLDERRVPLDMLLATYYVGNIGPISDSFVQGYVAIDERIGASPGTPAGSPWALPSLGAPSNDTRTIVYTPSRTFSDARGGAKYTFNIWETTFNIAHYYTYFDTPRLAVETSGRIGHGRAGFADDNRKTLLNAFNDGLPCPSALDPTKPDYNDRTCGAPAHAIQDTPRVQVTGMSGTFAVPSLYSVVRSEFAFFNGEPAFKQGQIDPFIFNLSQPQSTRKQTGGGRTRDSINAVVGVDRNQWIRFLNPNQTFFISTQFFYKHILNGGNGKVFTDDCQVANVQGVSQTICQLNPDREVLPITKDQQQFILNGGAVGRLEPIFITQPTHQFLQTLFIATSYRSGTINPAMTFFYDWGGAFVYQPSITFIQDPFRFTMDYSILDSHSLKGGSGVSLLKDRDNVQFRFEYVI